MKEQNNNTTTAAARPYISTSNSKTGVPSFNTLAGAGVYTGCIPSTDDAKKKISDALQAAGVDPDALHVYSVGTCQYNCPGCYAKKMTRYTDVYINMLINTIIARTDPDAIRRAVNSFCNLYEPRRFRIHDSGDFFSLEYLELWDRIATENDDVIFYTYTKRIDLLKQFSEKHGRRPAFIVQLSTWSGICELSDIAAAGLDDLPRFEYDDGSRPELAAVPHCPAVDKDGKRTGITCSQCKHCSRAKAGDVWAVYSH